MPQRAVGLPDPKAYGSPESLKPGQLVPWVIQQHLAERAGPHKDIRLGKDRMLSFATKKELPEPGEKRMLFQQPLHEEAYKEFEGEIPEGYGKGKVKKQEGGEVLVTSVGPDKVVFTTASRKEPQRFVLVRSKADPKQWLLANVTPTETVKQKKFRYIKLPADRVNEVLNEEFFISPKVDGAAAFYRLAKGKFDALSYRAAKDSGRPIVHTERLGLEGIKPKTDGNETLIRGEIYGERKGKAIPPQELGGLLNAAVARSRRKQEEQGTKLRGLLFGVRRFRGKDIPPETPWPEQERMLKEVMRQLPKDHFKIAPMIPGESPEARRLFERIRAGQEPLTEEGVVAVPKKGGRLVKVKFRPEADVYVREIFPGAKKLAGRAAGGFRYSLTPKGPIVGKVGTGLSEALREDMWKDPESFIGRAARIAAQERFPSGAYRAPSLISLHEDYPRVEKSAEDGKPVKVPVKKTPWVTRPPKTKIRASIPSQVGVLASIPGALFGSPTAAALGSLFGSHVGAARGPQQIAQLRKKMRPNKSPRLEGTFSNLEVGDVIPKQSLYSHLLPHYGQERLTAAIARARKAAKRLYDPESGYTKIDYDRVRKLFPGEVAELGPKHRGEYLPVFQKVRYAPQDIPISTIRHELSHGAFIPDRFWFGSSPLEIPGIYESTELSKPEYYLDPVEQDVRLADVKRLYELSTGKDVNTPADAQKALDYYNSRQATKNIYGDRITRWGFQPDPHFGLPIPHPYSILVDPKQPELKTYRGYGRTIHEYKKLMEQYPEFKKAVLNRMLQLVRAGRPQAVI